MSGVAATMELVVLVVLLDVVLLDVVLLMVVLEDDGADVEVVELLGVSNAWALAILVDKASAATRIDRPINGARSAMYAQHLDGRGKSMICTKAF